MDWPRLFLSFEHLSIDWLFGFCHSSFSSRFVFWNPHAVKRPVNEDQRNHEEEHANAGLGASLCFWHGHGDFRGQKAKERGELDHRVHRDRGGVLEWIPDG